MSHPHAMLSARHTPPSDPLAGRATAQRRRQRRPDAPRLDTDRAARSFRGRGLPAASRFPRSGRSGGYGHPPPVRSGRGPLDAWFGGHLTRQPPGLRRVGVRHELVDKDVDPVSRSSGPLVSSAPADGARRGLGVAVRSRLERSSLVLEIERRDGAFSLSGVVEGEDPGESGLGNALGLIGQPRGTLQAPTMRRGSVLHQARTPFHESATRHGECQRRSKKAPTAAHAHLGGIVEGRQRAAAARGLQTQPIRRCRRGHAADEIEEFDQLAARLGRIAFV
jgi:hypothetical protein